MQHEDRFCWSCGSGISKGDQFCRKCGSDLGQRQPIEQGHETQPEASTLPEIDTAKAEPAPKRKAEPPPAPESQDEESLSGSTVWFFLSVIGLLGWLLAGLFFVTTVFISLPNAIRTGGEYWATMTVFAGLLIIGTGVAAGIFCRRKLRRREGHKDGQRTDTNRVSSIGNIWFTSILIIVALLILGGSIGLQSYRSANYIHEDYRAAYDEIVKEIKHEESHPLIKSPSKSGSGARLRLQFKRGNLEELKAQQSRNGKGMPRSELLTPLIVLGVVYTSGLIILYRRSSRMR